MARYAVILPAAGKSSRYQDKEKKVFAPLDGRAVWLRAAELFVNRPDVLQTLIVIAPEDQDIFRHKFGAHLCLLGVEVVLGGEQRFDSVSNALARVREEAEFVAIHDAARPCVPTSVIDDVFACAARTGAALAGIPVADTLKRAGATGKVEATVPREHLWQAQTPQVFRRDWLVEAYARRGQVTAEITDDCQLIEAMGHPVQLVLGSAGNIKITAREDLQLAEAILKSRPKAKVARSIHPFEDEAKW
ncbi:MAG: 2-C-methyl-D-erythritol 4-phosphate cytidylyltransferase [Gemmataceae bacterium]